MMLLTSGEYSRLFFLYFHHEKASVCQLLNGGRLIEAGQGLEQGMVVQRHIAMMETTNLSTITPPALLRRHHNPRTRLRIRIGLMMPQINTQMAAHIRQLGRANIPLPAR
jgi:hypothetical protein